METHQQQPNLYGSARLLIEMTQTEYVHTLVSHRYQRWGSTPLCSASFPEICCRWWGSSSRVLSWIHGWLSQWSACWWRWECDGGDSAHRKNLEEECMYDVCVHNSFTCQNTIIINYYIMYVPKQVVEASENHRHAILAVLDVLLYCILRMSHVIEILASVPCSVAHIL